MHLRRWRALVALAFFALLTEATPVAAAELACPTPRAPYDLSYACAHAESQRATLAFEQVLSETRGAALLP
jgi:hypothetical protein